MSARPRILIVNPGASTSTIDVHNGYVAALTALGVDVHEYPLDRTIAYAVGWLEYQYRRRRKEQPDLVRPTWPDKVYLAGQGVLERALRLQVDAVVVSSGMFLFPDWLILLRRAGVRTVLIATESPYDTAAEVRMAGLVDVCFTNERTSVPVLRAANPNTHYLPHAYDPALHHPGRDLLDRQVERFDVAFVGTMFEERLRLLEGVNWEGIDLGLFGSFTLLPARHRLRKYVRAGEIPNERAAALYRRAKIGLNIYRTSVGFGRGVPHIDHAESLNPRALELAACGAFHLSTDRAEVREVFGDRVPTFADSASLEAAIRYYLSHEEERREKASALPAAVSGMTYAARARQLLATLAAAWSPRERSDTAAD